MYERIGVSPAEKARRKSVYANRLWWGILFIGVAAGIVGLVLGAVAVAKQNNGFSTPSLRVNQLAIGQEVPFRRVAGISKRNGEPMSLTVSGSTQISGDLEISGALKMPIPVGTTLTTSKTVQGNYGLVRTYKWVVVKSTLTPNVTIPANQCGTLAYHVDAQRVLISEEPYYSMNGTITVTNGGEVATHNLYVTDTLEQNCGGGTGFLPIRGPFVVDLSAKPILEAGETYAYTYNIQFQGPIDPACSYRNFVNVTITNHAGWQPGNNNCPGPELCPFGPQAHEPLTFPVEPTIQEVHENVKITDIATSPLGFTCTQMPEGMISIPTDGVCSFNGFMADCMIFKNVCNVDGMCDMHYSVCDYIELMSVNETFPLVINSNTVCSDIYTNVCSSGCTLTIGYWKTHAGFHGNNADHVTPLLPVSLGCNVDVTSAIQSTNILQFNGLAGGARNGLNKLAAQLLAAKYNIANGASGSPVASDITQADSYLCSYGFNPGSWDSLNKGTQNAIKRLAGDLDKYNNGESGVAHCE